MPRTALVDRRIRHEHEHHPKHDPRTALPVIEPMSAAAPTPESVRIAVLAVDSLGPASMRASFTGREVLVAVPDAATAAIFRAAIAETSQTRSTDRLIRIVID
ncbi:MAG: hypothetical protein WA459_03105 [Stellaceae bacterium]